MLFGNFTDFGFYTFRFYASVTYSSVAV